MSEIITGKVIQVINEYKIVINKGSVNGVTENNRFLVYKLGDELFDPDTNESLGTLELVCGEAKPVHIQEHITTLYTTKTKTTRTKIVTKGGFFGNTEETHDPEVVDVPFEDVDTDCFIRQIR